MNKNKNRPNCKICWEVRDSNTTNTSCKFTSEAENDAIQLLLKLLLLGSQLVISVLSDVSNPRQGLISTFLNDLQVAHLDSRGSEVRDFKLHADGRFSFLVLGLHARQPKVRPHQVLLSTREGFDGPDDLAVLRYPLHAAHRGLELGRVGVGGDRNVDLHVVGRRPPFELALGLDHILDSAMRVLLDHRLDPDQWLHMCVETVGHELKLSIW
uniref:Uncharacterized protein n=1 Tax=Anguilla anguilla TaxID=7936 RepID=A0A0E9XMI6_ANGAN